MDMNGKRALVFGASGGIGGAVAAALTARGAEVTGVSRSDGLDLTDVAATEGVLEALESTFDIVMIATGKLDGAGEPPEKSLKALSAAAMADQYAVNCIGPAMILRHVPRLLHRDRPGFCGVLSARVGSIGDNRLGGWYSYRASKAALNQIVHGAAIEVARTHPQAVLASLHPGTVATSFTSGFQDRDKLDPPEAARRLIDVLTGLTPDQTGTFWDHAGKEVVW